MNLTHKDVQEIVALLDASHFDELTIETSRFKLTLRRGGAGWTQETDTRAHMPAASATVAKPAARVALKRGEIAVMPPLPGTFYRAPKPGAAPFVEMGSKVEPGTVVAIIETMKLMTPVTAGARGTVTEICVENGTLIDQDAVLMKMKP